MKPSEAKITFEQLFTEITIWQQKTFGKRTDPRPPIHHLEKEIKELLENPTDLLEYADCFILLFNAADIAGYSAEDLLNGIRQKFEINQERKWGKADSNGVVLHVKE